jgi:diguanylate cyclase
MASDKTRGALRLATPSRADGQKQAAGTRGGRRLPADADDYYKRITICAQKIRETSDVGDIITILDEALGQTRALHTADEVAIARQQVVTAEQRIEQLRSELELVNKLVCEDQLTGALNRRGLDDAMAREAARDERNGMPLCIALIDIDNFKKINDSYGHQVGDIVLVHLVAIIKETIRTNDLIGRYGGEEFLLLLPDSRIDEATAVTARLQRELALKPIAWGNRQLLVTFSAGVATRRPGESEAALINRADQALYEAKRVGKDRIIVAA